MAWYARPSRRLVWQVVADVFVVVWSIAWWVVGRTVDRLVRGLAGPVDATRGAVDGLKENLVKAADGAGRIPLAGEGLRKPLDDAAANATAVSGQLTQQAELIASLATWLGWLVFLMPAVTLVVLWLPPRVRFVRSSSAAQRFIDADADLNLFALRAMATAPMEQLARISDDPVTAWRAGDRAVIDRLADLELRKSGLNSRRVRRRRGASAVITADAGEHELASGKDTC